MSAPAGNGQRPEPPRLLDPAARGRLSAAEARLAELFARAPAPRGLDDRGLARVRGRLRGRPRGGRPRAWRVGLAAGGLLLGLAGAGMAARYVGLPLPLYTPLVSRAPAPVTPKRRGPVITPHVPPRSPPPTAAPPAPLPPPARVPPPGPLPPPAVTTPAPSALLVPQVASTRATPRTSAPQPRRMASAAPPVTSSPVTLPPVAPPPVAPLPVLLPPLEPVVPVATDPAPSAVLPAPEAAPPPEDDRRGSALASEAGLLQEALLRLRRDRDGGAALEVLDRYAAFHPAGVLAPEAARARVDALFLLGRRQQARRHLERLTLEARGRDLELSVVRGELRAEGGDCAAAERDFSHALAARAPAALVERALHGRAVCRLRRGDEAGAARDFAAYDRRFPQGRFARRRSGAPGL